MKRPGLNLTVLWEEYRDAHPASCAASVCATLCVILSLSTDADATCGTIRLALLKNRSPGARLDAPHQARHGPRRPTSGRMPSPTARAPGQAGFIDPACRPAAASRFLA
jgi:hypothetical protein